jgi:thiamine transport system substrate-binding protein
LGAQGPPFSARWMENVMKTKFLTAGFLVATGVAHAETPVLNVLTYDSFVSEWGPGPAIEKAFEAECGCDLVFTGSGDGAALLARVQMEGAGSEADVVLGLDTNLTAAAAATELFAPHKVAGTFEIPMGWNDPLFVPYDYGWFAFVYDKTKLTNPPKNFTELAASDLKIVIQDPRSSTPGLGLVMWVQDAYGENASEIWTGLKDNILTVTPGWSEAYGLFTNGEADMVLSYTTSPTYHVVAESDETKAAAMFDEGHYLQVEVMGKLVASDQPELADKFLEFMVGDAAQTILPTTNWMYPVRTPAAGLGAGFDATPKPAISLLMKPELSMNRQDHAVEEWRSVLAQ